MDLRATVNAFSPSQLHIFTERMTVEVAKKVISPGDTVLDLGANVGYHTDTFSRLVGEAGMVHAFEPNPVLWPHLHRWSNVRLWPFAVGDELGVATLHVPVRPNSDQVATLIETTMFGATLPRSVPVVAIDILPEVIGASFVKIDIERYELQALNGMKGLIARCEPVIVFEGITPEIEAFFASIGYVTRQLAGDLYDRDNCPISNWIACKPERATQVALDPALVVELANEQIGHAEGASETPVEEPVLETPVVQTEAPAAPAAGQSWFARLLGRQA